MAINIKEGLDRIEGKQSREDQTIPPGSFQVSMATIHHGKPHNEHPIGDFIQRIYIFEDMEKFGITGWLDMFDTYNLVRNSLIIGEELLYLKFETAGVNVAGLKDWPVDFSKQPMQVHTVQNMKEMEANAGASIQSGLTYRLHFCSPELLTNNRVRVSRTLQGTYSDMIQDILVNDLKTTKHIEIEETTDLKHIIIPNLRPFDAINLITSSAQDETNKGGGKRRKSGNADMLFKGRQTDFYFWETSRGYKFLPAIRHYSGDDLVYTVGGAAVQVPFAQTMMTSINHSYVKTGDTLPTISSGLWGAKQILHDSTRKTFWSTQSNYLTSLEQNRYSLISETPVFDPSQSAEPNILGEPRRISDWPDSRVMFATYNSRSDTNINKKTLESDIPWVLVPSNLDLQRAMQTQHPMNYNTLSLRVHGISALECGRIVFLNLPNVGQGSGITGGTAVWEDRQDNLWIIKKLSHQIDARQDNMNYTCQLELANTFRYTSMKLPKYPGLGSTDVLRKTPTSPTIDILTDSGPVAKSGRKR